MRLPTEHAAADRLLAVIVLLAGLPLAVLGWVGWRMLEQDRALDSHLRRERLENAGNLLADNLSKVGSGSAAVIPPDVAWVLFDARGVIRRQGILLPYYPAVAGRDEAPAHVFRSAEVAEFQQAMPLEAAGQYRALSQSNDPVIRAGASMRLARSLLNSGKTDEALAAYGELTSLGDTSVAGAPAELVGRKQRASVFAAAGDPKAAALERKALASILAEGRYTIDKDTFDLYAEDLPDLSHGHPTLTRALQEWWPRWHAEPAGRATWTAHDMAFATVWTRTAEGTVAMVGHSDANLMALQQSAASRRNLLAFGLVLTTLVIVAAGYFGFRGLHRELQVVRLESEFVAQVSHEFRTPLAAMRHLTEMLEEGGAAAQERLPQFYRALGKETRRLHGMVEMLLDFRSIESGRRVYKLEETDLTDVAERVVSDLSSPRVRLTVRGETPHVRVDRELLALAVHNLVDNAIKYSPDSEPVDVTLEARDGRAGISVEDRGVGIPHAERRDVLRKFVRGSAARAMNVKGTGIGLAIVDQVARAHGGQLEVDSQVGRGSRFTIWVPSVELAS